MMRVWIFLLTFLKFSSSSVFKSVKRDTDDKIIQGEIDEDLSDFFDEVEKAQEVLDKVAGGGGRADADNQNLLDELNRPRNIVEREQAKQAALLNAMWNEHHNGPAVARLAVSGATYQGRTQPAGQHQFLMTGDSGPNPIISLLRQTSHLQSAAEPRLLVRPGLEEQPL